MDRFNGVATKYLDHYLSWFQFLDVIRFHNDPSTVSKMVTDICLLSTSATYERLRTTTFKL